MNQQLLAAERDAAQAYEELLEAWKPEIASALDQGGFSTADANVFAIMNTLRGKGLVPSTANIRNAMSVTGLIPKPTPPPPTEQEVRDQLERQIMELLVASSEEKERERKSYHARMAASREEIEGRHKTGPYLVTTATMLQRLVNLRESERLHSLSHAELRAEVRGNAQQHGFEPLPATFTPWQISQMSGAQWSEALRKYGVAQLNQRIQAQYEAGEWAHVPIVGRGE